MTNVLAAGARFVVRTEYPEPPIAGRVIEIRLKAGLVVRALHHDDWRLADTVVIEADGGGVQVITVTGPIGAAARILH